MNLLNVFKTKTKTVETNGAKLQKAQEELGQLQTEVSQKTTQKGQIQQALTVVSANLVIDPKDAEATKKKAQAEKKLAELTTEIGELNGKITQATEKVSEAQKAVAKSKGEVFKQERVKEATAVKVAHKLAQEFNGFKEGTAFNSQDWTDWASAYGYPVNNERVISPLIGATNSYHKKIVNNNEVIPVLRAEKEEVEKLSQEKADELTQKVFAYAEELLKAEGIELKKRNW
ncbi:hypothetical protein ACLM5H_24610 [Fredinandcohnia humi]